MGSARRRRGCGPLDRRAAGGPGRPSAHAPSSASVITSTTERRDHVRKPRRPYRGRVVALATKHGKERAIGRPLQAALGLEVVVPPNLDTDALGTFSGEVERVGTPKEVALRKARLGMAAAELPYGLASEGSFGPHPFIPFLPIGQELLVFVDDVLGIELSEFLIVEDTNFNHQVAAPGDDLTDFLQRIGFPSHAVIARPNIARPSATWDRQLLFKGLTEPATLKEAIAASAATSPDGRAHIETDMRAHLNPTRMASIRRLAFRLARRLATACPACGAPGWGRIDVELGLPCMDCSTPTDLVRAEILGCAACDHRSAHPRPDGRSHAEPGQCPYCNP